MIRIRRSRSRIANIRRALNIVRGIEEPIKRRARHKLSELNIDWINNISKTINDNGCWIPHIIPHPNNGYIILKIEGYDYRLHRLSLCISLNLVYSDSSFETRHGFGCDKRCFNPEHLRPGTHTDNMRDKIAHKNNKENKK